MRLFPPVPINARTANKITTLPIGGGPDRSSPILIQKDQKIVLITWATHRRTDIFGADALEFRPDRWETLPPESLVGYLPFLSGPRSCPGRELSSLPEKHTGLTFVTRAICFDESKLRGGEDLAEL